MANIYRQYNLSGEIKYRAEWECEKCGSRNDHIVSVFVSRAYNDNRTPMNKYDREYEIDRRKRETEAGIRDGMVQKNQIIQNNINKKDYTDLKMILSCGNCKKVPVWGYNARFDKFISAFHSIIIVIAVFCALGFVLLATSRDRFIPLLLIPAVLAMVLEIVKRMIDVFKRLKTKKCDAKYLPKITLLTNLNFEPEKKKRYGE
ncbi:MAG: hypothetical protein J5929_01160 [Eubacterium sp.]|nr:hypothetical protein [Eubacterium sp.]